MIEHIEHPGFRNRSWDRFRFDGPSYCAADEHSLLGEHLLYQSSAENPIWMPHTLSQWKHSQAI